ncbi:MAG: hypothetical protein QOE75_2591 [Solirubrobacterales bacterium]|jgi:hypothetical protein|nr:hypothetical protein [Solirubrobacterales bacterium]
MILASRAASRVTIAVCAAGLAALAIVIPGCGGDTPANARNTPVSSAENAAATQSPKAKPKPAAVDERCQQQVGGFLETMATLRERLVSGLSYEEYVGEIGVVRAAYDEVPVSQLALPCLSSTGTPAELAFDRYIGAANSWGGCIEEAECDAPTIEPVLQKQWRRASLLLDEAQSGLDA